MLAQIHCRPKLSRTCVPHKVSFNTVNAKGFPKGGFFLLACM